MAAIAAVTATYGHGQQITTAKVEFRNPGPFAQKELEAVAGVHPGQKLALKDMQAAAQRLADTGCFEDVHLDSKGSPDALTLIFILKPSVAGDLHPVAYENFVWFTPEELQEIVHKSAPLFAGQLPETEAVLDAVSAGLQQALAARGVPDAEVSHQLILATSAHPVSALSFRMNRPAVVLKTVTLDGISPEFASAMTVVERRLRGAVYAGDQAAISTGDMLLAPYRDAGYLDARMADQKVTPGALHNGMVDIDLIAKVESGARYKVASIHFDGTPIASAGAFEAASKLHAGDFASEKALESSLGTIDKIYHKLGYMDEYVDAGAAKDSASHSVAYTLKVVPGVIYHVHSVDVQGLPPEVKAQFDLAWVMKPGDAYDPNYVSAFLANNTAVRALAKFSGGFQAAADPSTQLVDLKVTFVPFGQ